MIKILKENIATLIVVFVFWLLVLSYGYTYPGVLNVSWQGDSNASAYEVQTSIDNGVSWTALTVIPPTNCSGAIVVCIATITLPDTGLVLIRYLSKNNIGQAVRYTSGHWYNYLWGPPANPSTLKVE